MMDKEEQLFRKRILELASVCYQRDVPVHTDFLNLHEQTIFYSLVSQFPKVRYELTGGYELAERKVVCFLPSYEDTLSVIPISCIRLEPVYPKFAEELSHRDYLGAVMNLGIERSKVGDILLDGSRCFLLCMEEMSSLISDELHTIRHTQVAGVSGPVFEMRIEPRFEEVSGSAASERLDAVLSVVYGVSRSKISDLIEGEKVFINGRLTTSNSCQLKTGEIISVRGFGKFVYRGIKSQTKKGRLMITAHKYC